MVHPVSIFHEGEEYVVATEAARLLRVSIRRLYQYLAPEYSGARLRSIKKGASYVALVDIQNFEPKKIGNPNLFKDSPSWKRRDKRAARYRKQMADLGFELFPK